MGNGRWAKVLRFLLCFFIVFAMLIINSTKSLLTARLSPVRSTIKLDK